MKIIISIFYGDYYILTEDLIISSNFFKLLRNYWINLSYQEFLIIDLFYRVIDEQINRNKDDTECYLSDSIGKIDLYKENIYGTHRIFICDYLFEKMKKKGSCEKIRKKSYKIL
jgi:hypothetical protein